jgi:hypothetical protein
MTELVQEVTAEEVQRSYNAAMDSVNLINAGQPEDMLDADWADCLARNVAHLEIMVAKTYWTDQDLSPLNSAIAAGK